MKILLIDDDPEEQLILKAAVNSINLPVEIEWKEASADVAKMVGEQLDDYDVILLGLNMPGMNGIEFFQKIPNRRENRKICLFTVSKDPALMMQAREAGILYLFAKPSKLEDYAAFIKELAFWAVDSK